MSAQMNCKICEFLMTLTDEELLGTMKCVERNVEHRWPGATSIIDEETASNPDLLAALQARCMNAIPKHLHHLLANRPQ